MTGSQRDPSSSPPPLLQVVDALNNIIRASAPPIHNSFHLWKVVATAVGLALAGRRDALPRMLLDPGEARIHPVPLSLPAIRAVAAGPVAPQVDGQRN